MVRVRVGDVRSKRWSAWSPPVKFGGSRPFVNMSPTFSAPFPSFLIKPRPFLYDSNPSCRHHLHAPLLQALTALPSPPCLSTSS